MKAYEIGDYATSRRVRLVERPDPVAGPGEALLRIRATGPNSRDFGIWTTRMFRPPSPDFIPMCDVSADVVCVGEGVSEFARGDRVTLPHYFRWLDGAWNQSMAREDYGCTLDGFLREFAVVPANILVRLPDSVSYEAAAALPSAGLTAWQAVVELGRVKPGDTMVTTGTGGVSVFAMQWGKMLGARVIVTSSSDEKLVRMRELGADETINYRDIPQWHNAVMALTNGQGADLVINTVGMPELDECLESCRSGARVMYIGSSPTTPDRTALTPIPPMRLPLLIIRDLTLKGVVVGSRRMMVDMIKAMDEQSITPIISKVYDFDQANDAIEYFRGGGKIGKVMIRVS